MTATIKTAVEADIEPIMDSSKSLLRKMSLDELRTWMGIDPEGFFVAESDGGRIVGTCCAIRLSPEEGFMGLLWVDASFRNKGIGSKLFESAMQHLGDRNVAVRTEKHFGDVTATKHGFTFEGDKILIYECLGRMPFPGRKTKPGIHVVTLVEGRLVKTQSRGSQNTADEKGGNPILTTEDIISKVEAYDRSLHDVDLSTLIREMFFWSSCRASVVLSSGRVIGFGCLRSVVTGHFVLSPLYADSEVIAEVILSDLLHGFDFSLTPEGVWARFPAKNTACIRLLRRFGFQDICFDFGTRFNKGLIKEDSSKIYSYYSSSFCME